MKITKKEIETTSITSLADRPNEGTGRFGTNGLSASELKAKMSALPRLIAERHNLLCDKFEEEKLANLEYFRAKGDSLSAEEIRELYRTKNDSYSKNECDDIFLKKHTIYSREESDGLFRKIKDSYSKTESDALFRKAESSYSKAETDEIFRTKSDSKSASEIESLEAKIGLSELSRGTDMSESLNELWEAVDGLWNGIGRRVIRGYKEYPDPPTDPASDSEFIALLNSTVLEATGRAEPDGSDAVQILDCESPGRNTCYTYYYWKPVVSDESDGTLDGWYVASIYQPPTVTELRAYTKIITVFGNPDDGTLSTEWEYSPEKKLYTYTIPATVHSAGASGSILVDMKLYIDGEYRSVQQHSVNSNGTVTLYSDEALPCICAIRAGSMHWLNDLPTAGATSLGAVKVAENGEGGLRMCGSERDTLSVSAATEADISARLSEFKPLTPSCIDALFASKIHLLSRSEYRAITPTEGDLYLITD